MMEYVHHISKAVYYCVREIIGHHEEVVMRRDSWDISDIIANYIFRKKLVRMTSGSRREGFEMNGSDYDIMLWRPHEHVICDLSQVNLLNTSTKRIILMEDQYSRPGFVLLRLFKQICTCNTCRNDILKTCILVNNHTYICSINVRCHFAKFFPFLRNSSLHGPCVSGLLGKEEYDFARCYASKQWPPQAFCWIERCKRKCWPSPSVLRNIIQNGCHFMAIGAKYSSAELVEWRLSFSQAEQKLVYALNHVQFLVYGLLKLFLKEVLNKEVPTDNKLLCSYFMKTAVFWEVQENIQIPWNINNFLFHFWKCYKLLMKWVYNEYCPNFFVPQNNMFYPKITGIRQQQLFGQMLDLYNEGLRCLLHCSSIYDKLYSALIFPLRPIITTCNILEPEHDLFLFGKIQNPLEIPIFKSRISHKSLLEDTLAFFLAKLKLNTSLLQRMVVYRQTIHVCQYLAFLLQINQGQQTNSETYKSRKQGFRLMKKMSKVGWVTDVFYLAIYMYIDGRYRQALHFLQEAQSKVYRCYVFYASACRCHYKQFLCGQSMSTKIKLAMACDIYIPVYTKFPELRLELRVIAQKKIPHLTVSPFVLLHFIKFLCHYHLGNTAQQQKSLHDFHILVHRDDEIYIHNQVKGTAWQMLGICHQLSNNPHRALESYWEAQRCYPFNNIQQLYRIQEVERQIHLDQLSQYSFTSS